MGTAKLALAVGGVAFVLTLWLGRPFVLTLGTLVVLSIAIVPVLPGAIPVGSVETALGGGVFGPRAEPGGPLLQTTFGTKTKSIVHRILIWQFVGDRILEKPLLGWGLDSSRSIPGGQQIVVPDDAAALSLHPHDAALQAWLELGVLGAFALACVSAVAFCTVSNFPRGTPRAAATATLVTAMVLLAASYGIWQNWWLAALAISATIVRAALPQPTAPPAPIGKPAARAPAPLGQPVAKIPTAKVPASLANR